MSAATSPGTGLAYGLRRVCAAWGMARSSFYAMTSGQHAEQPPAKRRGPKPAISDQALLVAIEADLEASPWEGEGYRKVWARLRVCRDIRVARKRVLRLMRENNLLSPHRCRRRGGNPHDGEIITHAPNLMWGTDGVRVFTVDDGWGWIFTAVEHWNAECVGCGAGIIARHPRSYDREDMVFDPIHYLPLLEHKIGALDQAAPLAGWELPDAFPTLRRLLEARMGKAGKREYVQVLRLLETFDLEVLHGAVKDALRLGAIGYDAVKHLVLCRIERRPPKLDLDIYPYLPRANVATMAAASYMSLLGGGAS